ncbi:VOC family protein [Actinocorallia sp. A-T 12471]|uniref:VOC family protein n=1 Tax=Actinocorallia sp. A-T 12471 TaxID=3089813 RepID=UPI0029CF7573|nr:VOC family protein [Actinocorallia sp. A-T 12471]MDX6741678.1 VOC family protein [Actinocorallia sp. A-T 12471]
MALHQLSSITIGVPNVEETAAYYAEFGLTPHGDGSFSTEDGGRQLRLVSAPVRKLLALEIGVDDPDDLDRIASQLDGLDLGHRRDGAALVTEEPVAGFRATVAVRPRIRQESAATPYNGPGRVDRAGRAPGIMRDEPVKPRKLGHVVIGSTDQAATQRFFTDGLGFKISDVIPSVAAFMRCSPDHHNVLVQQAPLNFLHHSSWQVEDIDEIGRGATAMLEKDPSRHVWGLGRHHVGSNFFWYLKDPAGNFAEYYSDIDCIVDDALWTPSEWEGAQSLYNWGPPPPPSFLAPEDLAALMTGAHSS